VLAVAVAVLAGAAASWATPTGFLIPAGCIADVDDNPAACPKTTDGLQYSYSLSISSDGKSVYVAGDDDNSIVNLRRNRSTGVLNPAGCVGDALANPAGCAKTARGLDGATAVAVSPDGRSVYAASCCGSNAIVTLRRNRTNGKLTPKGCIGDDEFNPGGCARTAKGLEYAAWVAVTPDGKSVYVAGYETGMLALFRRNTSTGRLTPIGCIADPDTNVDDCAQTARGLDTGASEHSIAISSNGKWVYVSADADNAIARLRRNTASGALTPVGCIADSSDNPDGCAETARGLGGAWAVALSADGKSLYAVSEGDSAIVSFKRNRTTGALTSQGCIASPSNNPASCGRTAKGLDAAHRLAVSGDGKSVYVATGANAVVRFARKRSTGRLTPLGCIADPANNPAGCSRTAQGLYGPYSIVASNDGKSVYATSLNDNSVVSFERQH
jgi:6-phosphogluconolactonase (cycloisomerase 2 family)